MLALAGLLWTVTATAAQPGSSQSLDRVMAFSPNAVINMTTGNAPRPPDFTDLGISGNSFAACALNAVSGLYCLDGKSLRNWPTPTKPEISSEILNCADPALGLDTTWNACTGVTVDQSGAIWLAGKRWFTQVLIKVVNKGTACPSAAWRTLASGQLCALDYYGFRPLFLDSLKPVDGDAATSFVACPFCTPKAGVLALEGADAVFYPDPRQAFPVTSVFWWQWGLHNWPWSPFGPEVLQDVALLQVPNGGQIDSYVIGVTNHGRILAKNPALPGFAREVYDINAARNGAASCTSGLPQRHALQVSLNEPVVYVSDRKYCQVLVLKPDSSGLNSLVHVQKNGADVVLSTVDTSYEPDFVLPPTGLAIAAGLGIDLDGCKLSCNWLWGSGGEPAAGVANLHITDDAFGGGTAFQVTIPDCRYKSALDFPQCDLPGVIVMGLPGPDGNVLCSVACPPSAQWLNVTPLLPTVVRNAYAASRGGASMPQLLISPFYRGQQRTGFNIGALIVITNPNARFQGIFTTEFDVPLLESSTESLGCIPDPANLLAWDLATDVSADYVGIGGAHTDMLTNTGCGSLKGDGIRFTMTSFNLEVTSATYGYTQTSTTPQLTPNNDAVYARLMQTLFGELGYVLRELGCKQVDLPGGLPPLTGSQCDTLRHFWELGKDKLDQCVAAQFRVEKGNSKKDKPKSSPGKENCQAFVSQLNNFKVRIPTVTPPQDIANRLAELLARVHTLEHVYSTRFLPSIPAGGFCVESNSCSP